MLKGLYWAFKYTTLLVKLLICYVMSCKILWPFEQYFKWPSGSHKLDISYLNGFFFFFNISAVTSQINFYWIQFYVSVHSIFPKFVFVSGHKKLLTIISMAGQGIFTTPILALNFTPLSSCFQPSAVSFIFSRASLKMSKKYEKKRTSLGKERQQKSDQTQHCASCYVNYHSGENWAFQITRNSLILH